MIVMAAVGGDFYAIPSVTQKVLAYGVVALAPAVAIYMRKWRGRQLSYQSFLQNTALATLASLAVALPILYFWRGQV